MKSAVIAALLGITQGVRIKDDFLVETPTVAEFMDYQADLNVLSNVKKDIMEDIPDNMQVTYPQAMKFLHQGQQNKEEEGQRSSVRVNHREE